MQPKNPHQSGPQPLFDDLGYNPLVYYWIAFYKDKTVLPQFDFETGKENLFSDIVQAKLESIGWFPFTQELADQIAKTGLIVYARQLPIFKTKITNGQRLILFRRNTVSVSLKTGEMKGRKTFYLLGWQQTVNGSNIKAILKIDENGNALLGDE